MSEPAVDNQGSFGDITRACGWAFALVRRAFYAEAMVLIKVVS
ncbi:MULTISPECIES: hypothetical protein [Actinotignum]|nr:hypothetical protein [Actinotignum timonense]